MKHGDGIIPSGSLPPNSDKASDGSNPEPSTSRIKVGDREMAPEELAKSYEELQKKLGSQGNELGKYRSQNELLMNQLSTMQQMQAKPKEPEKPKADFEALQKELLQGIETGDLSLEDALKKGLSLANENATHKAREATRLAVEEAQAAFQKAWKERDAQEVQNRFLSKNKDFIDFRQSEDAARIKAENPLHDDVSAYYEWKAIQAQQQYEDLQKKIEAGAKPAGPVLDKPGNSIRSQNLNKPRSFEERRAAARAAAGLS